MSGDRPTHAVTIRPAVVELPMWVLSRGVHLGRRIRRRAVRVADAYPDTIAGQLHVAGWLAVATCAVDAVIAAARLIT
jgi:hypothetical protein